MVNSMGREDEDLSFVMSILDRMKEWRNETTAYRGIVFVSLLYVFFFNQLFMAEPTPETYDPYIQYIILRKVVSVEHPLITRIWLRAKRGIWEPSWHKDAMVDNAVVFP